MNRHDQHSGASRLATFAGGCFWCLQPPFDALPGVISTRVGYCGGEEPEPSYEQVCSGRTGHAEAIQIVYDPERIGYRQLLEVFWRNIDPTTRDRQFFDSGSQYRTAIFYHDDAQRREAQRSKRELEQSGRYPREIVTEIVAARPFHDAEEYHQQYYRKCPLRYQAYHDHSGRDRYLERIWGKDR